MSPLTFSLTRTSETVDLLLDTCESHGCLPDLDTGYHWAHSLDPYQGFTCGVHSGLEVHHVAYKQWLPRQQKRCAIHDG